LERDLPGRRPRHIQQVVDQAREVMGLPMNDLSQPRRRLLGAGSATIEDGDGVGDRAKRVAQLVGSVARNSSLARLASAVSR